ncbi:MAG: hypothetical protein WBV82_08950 [Myxococcaceae bacterium]
MKRALWAGALAVSLWGGAAMAGGDKDKGKDEGKGGAGEAGTESVLVEPELEGAEEGINNRGVQVFLGGGVEGFTGGIAPIIDAGPAYGATVAFKPLGWLGLELGYSGARNNVSDEFAIGDSNIMKNGGQALATIGFTTTRVQPYIAGGFGIDRYDVRGEETVVQDDTLSYVPVGVGLRTYFGDFSADARFTGQSLISQDLVPGQGSTDLSELSSTIPDARYNAMIRLGATF